MSDAEESKMEWGDKTPPLSTEPGCASRPMARQYKIFGEIADRGKSSQDNEYE